MDTVKNDDFRIEEGFSKIESILVKMENPETQLEELFEMYKEGTGLLKMCNEAIEKVEKEIERISL